VTLTPDLEILAKNLGFVIDSAIREGSEFDKLLKGPLKTGLERFGEIMESGQFREGTEKFLSNTLTVIKLVESIGWGDLLSGYATLKGAQIGARIGGMVGGLPGSIVGGTIGAMAAGLAVQALRAGPHRKASLMTLLSALVVAAKRRRKPHHRQAHRPNPTFRSPKLTMPRHKPLRVVSTRRFRPIASGQCPRTCRTCAQANGNQTTQRPEL